MFNYNECFNDLKMAISRYRPSGEISKEMQDMIVSDMFYRERCLVNAVQSEGDIIAVRSLAMNYLNGSELEKRFQEILLSDLDEKFRSLNSQDKEMKM